MQLRANEYFQKLKEAGIRGRVYIAGPMRGLPELNHPAFYEAERDWRARGWLVVNPARLDANGAEMTFEACMRRDIRKLMDCHAIALLPDHDKSEGAAWEKAAGVLVGNRLFESYDGTPHPGVKVTLTINDRTVQRFEGEIDV